MIYYTSIKSYYFTDESDFILAPELQKRYEELGNIDKNLIFWG